MSSKRRNPGSAGALNVKPLPRLPVNQPALIAATTGTDAPLFQPKRVWLLS